MKSSVSDIFFFFLGPFLSTTGGTYLPQVVIYLPQLVSISNMWYLSPTGGIYLPQVVSISHRGDLSPTVGIYHPQVVSIPHSCYLSPTVGIYPPQEVSIPHRWYLSPTGGIYHHCSFACDICLISSWLLQPKGLNQLYLAGDIFIWSTRSAVVYCRCVKYSNMNQVQWRLVQIQTIVVQWSNATQYRWSIAQLEICVVYWSIVQEY